jgi:hypothetical protein
VGIARLLHIALFSTGINIGKFTKINAKLYNGIINILKKVGLTNEDKYTENNILKTTATKFMMIA